MSILFVTTDNEDVRQMLENQIRNRRPTDSGFDVPMLQESVGGVSLHTFNLHIKVAAMKHNVPVPCLLVPRSSISGTPFRLANSIGLIDSGYRGEVKAKVDVLTNGVVENGSRLFQICSHDFMPWDTVLIVNELPAAQDNRGEGGFGSTG
jgi:dUTPase